jgi:hypothetical protein
MYGMIVKEARKPSTDPVQEKLRQEKAQWNKATSTFINDLINFKKLMNGAPNKFYMQRSKIQEPIPSDPTTIIGVLADDYQELAQKAKAIIEHQIQYSKTRRRKQPKLTPGVPTETEATPTTPAGAPDLTQQLAPGLRAASLETQLRVEASNPLSRFISRFRRPWFRNESEARQNRYRRSLLKSALELDKDLAKLEDEIVGSTPESIFTASRLLKKIRDRLAFLAGSIQSYQAQEPKAPDLPSEDDPKIQQAKTVVQDFLRHESNLPDLNRKLKSEFHDLHAKFLRSLPPEKNQLAGQIIDTYQALLDATNTKHGTTATNFLELLNQLQDQRAQEAIKQEVVANAALISQGGFLTRWLGKIKHKISPFDKTSALRLDIYKETGEARTRLDQMMDALEKSLDLEEVQQGMSDLANKIASMQNLMSPLLSIIREKMLDPAFMKKFKSQHVLDYGFDIADPDFQKRLQQWRRTEQLRELIR